MTFHRTAADLDFNYETEARCPVYNLMAAADVKLDTLWVRRTPA